MFHSASRNIFKKLAEEVASNANRALAYTSEHAKNSVMGDYLSLPNIGLLCS
jgi:hypothetical protein